MIRCRPRPSNPSRSRAAAASVASPRPWKALLAGAASVGPWQKTLIPGRLVSVAAAVLTALVIAVVVWRRTASAVCGLTAGVLYLGYPIIAYWFHDYRVDGLACFFAIAAYVFVVG